MAERTFRQRHWLPILGAALLLSLGSAVATASDDDESRSGESDQLTIERARWDDGRLRVRGEKDKDVTVTVVNAFDPGQVLGRDRDDDDDWRVRTRRANPVPCRVRAIGSDGQTAERDVRGAPANCAPKDDNQPPVQECNIAVNPTALAFGDVNVGSSATLSTTVSNNGDAACDVSIARTGSNDFSATPLNFSVAPGGSRAVSVSYEPAQAGADNGSLAVNSNDPDSPTVNVALSGNGVEQQVQECNIAVNPTTLAFGDVTVGSSATLSTTVSNSGSAACNVTIAQTGSADFAAAPLTFNVAPGGSRAVSVSYTPGEVGTDTGNLAVGSNDPDTPSVDVALSGNGVQQQVQECNIAVGPTTLAFGNVVVGSSATLSTTISNSGAAVCNVDLNQGGSNDFAIVGATLFNVAPGGSQSVDVTYTPGAAGADTGNIAVNSNDPDTPTVNVTLTGTGVDQQVQCQPATDALSINSTAQDGCPETTVAEVNPLLNTNFRVLAINDLGMHCGDLDTRISSILPPFQVLLGQVIQRGATPTLNPAGITLEYSAASNPNDPAVGPGQTFPGLKGDGSTYKTNFWDVIGGGAYDPFYPPVATPLLTGPFPVLPDVGLPVPNPEELYIGADGVVNSGDETLHVVQHAMPGLTAPYLINEPQAVQEFFGSKPFFVNFPFGYVAPEVNWFEAAGIPFAAYDDYGRENAYPLVRVEAKQGNQTVGTVDTVLPISGEASCTNCHSDPTDVQNSRTAVPTQTLTAAGLPVALSLDDPNPNLPNDVSVEYAADINILRLHDLRHGANYVDPNGDPAPCDVTANAGDGDANCLINKALIQGNAVVCQVCHYTPALDLAQVGPLAGPPGSEANGRNQLAHKSNSNVMHSHHGLVDTQGRSPGDAGYNPNSLLFADMPAPIQTANGTITNQAERLQVLEDTCYQCHPGTNVQCLRGAMFNGGMLCNDCHGNMEQVGNDFSAEVSPDNPGAFVLDQGNFYDPNSNQPRVPWANEPGCGSCHTGDVRNNLAGSVNSIVNTVDIDGNPDGIRLRQAFRTGDAKATPIVPTNKRFAEPAVPASFNGFANPGAGNPQLYRVSTGHGGVMCEGCHGATHAEWPNANPDANDNVTANQLQGHVGTLTECGTCHTNINSLGTNGSLNSLRGPHGMHVVGNTQFADGGHADNLNRNACRDCHGQNGEGSVLSRTAADRNLPDVGFVPKGTPITCSMCHGNEL